MVLIMVVISVENNNDLIAQSYEYLELQSVIYIVTHFLCGVNIHSGLNFCSADGYYTVVYFFAEPIFVTQSQIVKQCLLQRLLSLSYMFNTDIQLWYCTLASV